MPIQLYVVIKLCQGIGYACYYFVFGIFWTWRALLALLLTPAGHRRIGAYRDLRACTRAGERMLRRHARLAQRCH